MYYEMCYEMCYHSFENTLFSTHIQILKDYAVSLISYLQQTKNLKKKRRRIFFSLVIRSSSDC